MNDETFGSEATIGDWEKDHEKLAEITESNRPHHQNTLSKKVNRFIIPFFINNHLYQLICKKIMITVTECNQFRYRR